MRSLWGVARHTFQESLRTRVLVVFLIVLVVCVLAVGLLMVSKGDTFAASHGEGTLKSRIQTFLSYSTGLTELLLGLVTIFLATGMVSSDIYRKQIFTVVTKPLPRWQYVLGRWLGLVMLNALLLKIGRAHV
jgi:ABC-type transport system involved in multi-copper enzyme maturation permease subunit